MGSIFAGGVFLSVTLLLLAQAARAELPCLEPVHEVLYDGCLLPDDPANPDPWTIDPGSHGQPYISDCQLVIPVEDPLGYFGYRRYDEAFGTAETYRFEAMVRAEEFYLPGTFVNVTFGISDGQKSAFIGLTHNSQTGGMWVDACDQAPVCTSIEIDWSQYHLYRIEVRKTGKARFYVDGQMFHETDYEFLRDSNIPPHLAVFGGAESISWWDWISYDTCSNAPPENRPPVANAGLDFQAETLELVTLDGIQSYDPDGDEISYLWAQTTGPEVMLFFSDFVQSQFIAPPVSEPTLFCFSLIVSDFQFSSEPDEVCVFVPASEMPSLSEIMDQMVSVQPDIFQQIDNLIGVVRDVNMPHSTSTWLENQLNEVKEIELSHDRAVKLLEIQRHFFRIKSNRVAISDAMTIESYLDMAVANQDLEFSVQETPLFGLIVNESFEYSYPEEEGVYLMFSVSNGIIPHGQHVSNSGKFSFGILYNIGIINMETLEYVANVSSFYQLPDRLRRNEMFSTDVVTIDWDGKEYDGSDVDRTDKILFIVSAQYVSIDKSTGFISSYYDRVATKMFWAQMGLVDWVRPYEICFIRETIYIFCRRCPDGMIYCLSKGWKEMVCTTYTMLIGINGGVEIPCI